MNSGLSVNQIKMTKLVKFKSYFGFGWQKCNKIYFWCVIVCLFPAFEVSFILCLLVDGVTKTQQILLESLTTIVLKRNIFTLRKHDLFQLAKQKTRDKKRSQMTGNIENSIINFFNFHITPHTDVNLYYILFIKIIVRFNLLQWHFWPEANLASTAILARNSPTEMLFIFAARSFTTYWVRWIFTK